VTVPTYWLTPCAVSEPWAMDGPGGEVGFRPIAPVIVQTPLTECTVIVVPAGPDDGLIE
jgi:hypothetical protein